MASHDGDDGYEPPEVCDIESADDREFAVVPATVVDPSIEFRN